MPSSFTKNYQLSQWERSDKVQMEDFNADNAKLDAALKAQADVLAGLPQFVTGSYTGDGSETRTINLGFRPKAVYLGCADGATLIYANGNYCYGGLFFEGHPLKFHDLFTIAEITSSGFTVHEATINSFGSYYYSYVNLNNFTFYYIAMR